MDGGTKWGGGPEEEVPTVLVGVILGGMVRGAFPEGLTLERSLFLF